ncbi:MAG: hypothetical protein KIH65_002335 [Candidatus Uhrbacteria bacterium]|nr:hypothetical protein [Candidatus Uhrbacteria bacterium]
MKSKRMVISAIVLSFIITAGTMGIIRAADAATTRSAEQNVHTRSLGNSFKNRKTMRHAFQGIRAAIEANDYEAWAKLTSERPHDPNMITPETFQKLREAYLLRQQGDEEGARKITEALGVQKFGSRKIARKQFQAVRNAIESHDYETWAKLMQDIADANTRPIDTTREAFDALTAR